MKKKYSGQRAGEKNNLAPILSEKYISAPTKNPSPRALHMMNYFPPNKAF